MSSRVGSFRSDSKEWDRWIEAAHVQGSSLNGWARRELNLAADRVLAERRRVEDARLERERQQALLRPFRPDFKKGQ